MEKVEKLKKSSDDIEIMLGIQHPERAGISEDDMELIRERVMNKLETEKKRSDDGYK